MPKERILVTVKTYPTLSQKYGELVCTAGLRANGSWVRLYPVPFRRMHPEDRYNKFDWIETVISKSRSDHRPESYRINDPDDIQQVGHVGTEHGWQERRKLLLQPGTVHTQLKPLMEGAKANRLSLATFKPVRL